MSLFQTSRPLPWLHFLLPWLFPGGSRGNPGHTALRALVLREHGEPQLSGFLVFSGQRHSAYRATAETQRVRPRPGVRPYPLPPWGPLTWSSPDPEAAPLPCPQGPRLPVYRPPQSPVGERGRRSQQRGVSPPPPPGTICPSPPCSGRWAASSRSCSPCRAPASFREQPGAPAPGSPRLSPELCPPSPTPAQVPRPCPMLHPRRRSPSPARTHSAAMRASCSASLTAASSCSRLSPAPFSRPLAYQVRSRPFCQRPTGAISELPAGRSASPGRGSVRSQPPSSRAQTDPRTVLTQVVLPLLVGLHVLPVELVLPAAHAAPAGSEHGARPPAAPGAPRIPAALASAPAPASRIVTTTA